MAEFVYVDETGADGSGGKSSPILLLAAVIVPDGALNSLSLELARIASATGGNSEVRGELHGHEIWNRSGRWRGLPHSVCLDAYQEAIGLLTRFEIGVAHSSIRKTALSGIEGKLRSRKAYLMALQFLLEKIDAIPGSGPRLVIADRAKQYEVDAIGMFADIQLSGIGEVPGRKYRRIGDSLHYVDSKFSSGVQLADLVAYVLQRRMKQYESHVDAEAAMARMHAEVISRRVTWRETWPAGG